MTAPRSRTVTATSAVLAVCVVLLSLLGWLGFRSITGSINELSALGRTINAFQGVQRALMGEVSAEAGYRRTPDEQSRARVVDSLQGMAEAITQVRSVGTAGDRASAVQLDAASGQYASFMQALISGPVRAPGQELPLRPVRSSPSAGPQAAVEKIQQVTDSALVRYGERARAATRHQRRVIHRMGLAAPALLAATFTALSLSWFFLAARGRRAEIRAASSERLALQDTLTGLANRRALERVLATELASPTPDCALLLLDLDGFKAINDTWGHEVGDEVLRLVARRIRMSLRASDTAARLGGDEFAVLIRPSRQYEQLQERLREAIGQPAQLRGILLQPGVSIGACVLEPGVSRDAAFKQADAAMYADKRSRGTATLKDRRSS